MRAALVVARVVAAAAVTEAEAALVAYGQGLLVGSSAAAARAAAATPLVVAATVAMAAITAGLVVEATEAEVGDCFPCHHRCRDSGGKRCRSACRLFASWTHHRRNSLAPGRRHMARSS